MLRTTEHLWVHGGPVNVGVVRDGGRALLIEYGDAALDDELAEIGVTDVEKVLFTHHHRDQTSGVHAAVERGTAIGVSAEERSWFEDVESYWNDEAQRWHIYNDHPHPLMLAESVRVDEAYHDGQIITWGPATITCIATPGHTDGSLSYLVDVDGARVAFTGDLIYDSGQIWELYSLQEAEAGFTDYHGFLGARQALRDSLTRVLAETPDRLVPSHGRLIEEPASAVARLLSRIDDCYERYVGILTLRYDYPEIYESYEGCRGWMPIGEDRERPDFLRHIGTSWLVVSETGEALLTDCGSGQVVETVEGLVDSGEIIGVTEAWVTHYHDDHVDAYPEFQRRFDCVTRASEVVADVVENPLAHRLPCGSPSVVRVDHRTRDGESWLWNEFTLTAYHLPGQTYYGGALVVDGRGARILFVGDSFSPAGIDDYCAGNRNFLGDGVGFQRCLDIIELVQPTHTFHCHIDRAVAFTEGEIRHMRANLRDRQTRFGELFPWDHPNYGMDPHWARCYPYEQLVHRGECATLSLEVTNHSSESRTVECRPVFPRPWRLDVAPTSADVQGKRDGRVPFRFRVPSDADVGRTVIPFDVTYDGRRLGQFREAVVVVSAG